MGPSLASRTSMMKMLLVLSMLLPLYALPMGTAGAVLHKLDERFAAATEPANHRQLGWRWWEQNEDASWKATSSCPWFCKQGWFWQADAYAKPACCNEVRDSPYNNCVHDRCQCDASCRS